MTLAGKGAVVTGGGRGIGAAIARALVASGASVVVTARSAKEIEAVAAELRRSGSRAWAVPCDVGDPAGVRTMAAAALQHLGQVDVLVNNAGIAGSAPVDKITLEDWNAHFLVNATGSLLCTQAFLPGMLARGWGRIVNVASIAGLQGARYIAAYAASKHALLGLTRCLAAEVAAGGVTANAVCPGYVDAPMTEASLARIVAATGRSREQALDALRAASPQRRLITPEEVAHAVVSLCADHARGINGQAIVLDGGGLLA